MQLEESHGAPEVTEHDQVLYMGPPEQRPPFTDEFGQLPELDFTETPEGMMYIATRRVGDNIWARMVEADAYEASQRKPGDYEAQVSQRPIAIHGLEHLGFTDRGVTMFRQLLRHGIRAVQDGRSPNGLCRETDTVIGTYANDTVVRLPAAATAENDRQLMRATGRKLAESYLAHPPLLTTKGFEKAAREGNQSLVKSLFADSA
jgi:hypothetical protein